MRVQLLHGKDGSHGTTWALKACYEILQESFDPIIDQVSRQDLVRGMVYSEQQGEWDHTGMFTAILRHKVDSPPPPSYSPLLPIKATRLKLTKIMFFRRRVVSFGGHLLCQLFSQAD